MKHEFRCVANASFMEWHKGTDIQSPDYECGLSFLLTYLLRLIPGVKRAL